MNKVKIYDGAEKKSFYKYYEAPMYEPSTEVKAIIDGNLKRNPVDGLSIHERKMVVY